MLLLLATGCQGAQLRPAAIEKDDVCAGCKMAISQPRYAAQVVDKEGNQHKFDDIGCMLRFIREHKMKDSGAAFFVMDYVGGKDWLDARTAVFVKSDAIASPMASGLAAFRDQAAAKEFADKNKGQVWRFEQLGSGGQSASPQR